MGIFKEVARGLGGIAGEVARQITGAKPNKHRSQYSNLKRYTTKELTEVSRNIQNLAKEAFKK
jgi:hypothetical protein